ncbi:hypothetical protein [Arachidicoccus terrestris]|uniref:hypothetical protein n=1 Tax=Arachidicoccus terrestris TaxID=2875539 RepID=UPI001CC76933|nr:hypothetical protein [Arachidicoccus terrestris]UAY55985.1 hypothetical protein K9M52_02845 [Arachidicoccus terrestris]
MKYKDKIDMTKDELLKLLNEGWIPPNAYSLGYEIKNLATNIHTLSNGKYYVFSLDERGNKTIIKTDIDTIEEAYDVVYNKFKVTMERRKELYGPQKNRDL